METGGRIPKASAVRKIIFVGCVSIVAGISAFGMYSNGYAQRVFSVSEPSP